MKLHPIILKIIRVASANTQLNYHETRLIELLEKAKIYPNDIDFAVSTLLKEKEFHERDITRIERFSDILSELLFDHVNSIKIYLKIINSFPLCPHLYRKLMDLYIYDINSLCDFNFIENINRCDLNPSRVRGDDNLVIMSFTYIGNLYQKLGKFHSARESLLRAVKYTPNEYRPIVESMKQIARFGLAELQFLANVNKIDLDLLNANKSKKNENINNLILGSVFFGDQYRELLQNISCATIFCESNLASLKSHWNPYFLIFCPLLDELHLKQSKFYKIITNKLPVRIITIPENIFASFHKPPEGKPFHPSLPYSVSALAQTALIIIAKRHGAALINIPPDAIFSNNAIETLNKEVEKNSEVILTAGVRLNREDVVHHLKRLTTPDGIYEHSISSSSLTKLALENLHALSKALFLSEPRITYPGMFFWPNKSGIVGHFFQMHPIYLSKHVIEHSPIVQFNSIDGDFLSLIIPDKNDWNNISILSNSDSSIMFELTNSNFEFSLVFNSSLLITEASPWLCKFMRPINYFIFKNEVTFGKYDKNTDVLIDERKVLLSQVAELIELSTYEPLKNSRAFAKITAEEYAKLIINELVPQKIGKDVNSFSGMEKFGASDMKILFTVSVWGKSYIENFLNICLPSMLSSGNLESVCSKYDHVFLIYTENSDINIFKANILFQSLLGIINFEFIIISPGTYANKYEVVNFSQSDSIQKCRGYDAIFFLYADFVWSTGSMEFAVRKIEDGYDGVISPVPPLVLESFYEDLSDYANLQTSYFSVDDYLRLTISPRQLVKFTKSHLHPMMAHNNMDTFPNSGNPAYLLWYGPNQNLLIRCIHIHPVVLKVKHESPDFWRPFEGTLDEWFLPFVYCSLEKMYTIKDSDELAIISLTSINFPLGMISDTFRLDSKYIAGWAENLAAPLQKSLLSDYTIWHDDEVKQEQWIQTIERSERLVREVLFFLQMPDSVLMSEFSDVFASRNTRQLRFGGRFTRSSTSAPQEENLNNNTNILIQQVKFRIMVLYYLRKFMLRNLSSNSIIFIKKIMVKLRSIHRNRVLR